MCHDNHFLSTDASIVLSKNCPITGEHDIILVTQKITIATLWTAKSTLDLNFNYALAYISKTAEIKGVLAAHSVAMVNYCVTKIISICLTVIGQFLDTMIVASI